ncbi:anion transporter [Methylocaldum szegediense]|uniref:Arsenical pump membrane protein n=1 Tax=Methylocaldum szegediense TaxID=73780 RepID=A0ABM9I140_9GAMM|nr:anion transporter [Methylocaldum szegediense]CAI8820583.1 arsenical pump membrane protein [Methylocaldum szegediense]
MIATIVIVFSLVYIGMIRGGLPFLQLDRTGIAVLGAIALIATKSLTLDEAAKALHIPTLILLFSFMVISAQLRLSGFYMLVTEKLGALRVSPAVFLAALIAVAAGLSSVFSNDVVCLAVAPVLIDICLNRHIDPVPFLLALSCSANIGSAATLIGNPQNMLIGETLKMSFVDYLRDAVVPVGAGLVMTWLLIALFWRGRWAFDPRFAVVHRDPRFEPHARFDLWQAAKGLTVAAGLFGAFLFSDWPREILALGGAGILLLSRKLHSTHMLGLVDRQIILMFIGLFIVNYAVETTELPKQGVSALAQAGFDLHDPELLYGASFLLSNVVSNVPAVMLLLPMATHPDAGLLLALSSTFAGNLLIVGSVANMIVVDAAARRNIVISWRRHALVGVPVTLLTITIAAAWYWLGIR